MFGIDPMNYKYAFMFAYCIPIVYLFARNVRSTGNRYLLTQQSQVPMTIYIYFLILFIGFRPIYGPAFADMPGYRLAFNMVGVGDEYFSWHSEWGWVSIMSICKRIGMSVNWWFATITVGYLGCMLLTCKKLLYENINVAVLFFLSSLTFYTYGVNTIRSGFACNLALLAIAFLADKSTKSNIIATILLILGFGIHRSTIVVLGAIFASLFLVKKVKTAIVIWILCIIVSIFFSGAISSISTGISFDDRFEAYSNHVSQEGEFSHTGFRWDFLLYSSLPVIVAWFVCMVKKVEDQVFEFITTIYILANSVWVLFIRMSFSDRFAYLSWFMYPLVIAYAFIRLPLFSKQDSITSWVLLGYAGITLTLQLVFGK